MKETGSARERYGQAAEGQDVRKNLIAVRDMMKDERTRREFMYGLQGDFSVLESMLGSEDPKIRRNAALILGYTEDEDVLPALVSAWKSEQTLFIREDYLKAMEMMDYHRYLPDLQERLVQISGGGEKAQQDENGNALWDNQKHLEAEAQRLRKMIDRFRPHEKHICSAAAPMPAVLLLCSRSQSEATARQIRSGQVRQLRGAVRVQGGDPAEILSVRTWSECLFLIPGARPVPADPKAAADSIHSLHVGRYLCSLHGIMPPEESDGEGVQTCFRYRIELKGSRIPQEKKGAYIRAFSARLDYLEQGLMENSDSDYEVELRLVERSDGMLAPMLKLFTFQDRRFAYRRLVTAQSMAPVNAALAVELSRPWQKRGAQILDPFCGTGTLLIERCFHSETGDVYGVDRFGDAIRKARVNAEKMHRINFVNRDFFDFRSDYPFDEIITEFPEPGKEEEEMFMARFVRRCGELFSPQAVLIAVTGSPRALEDAAQETGQFVKQQEYLLNERTGVKEMIFTFHR